VLKNATKYQRHFLLTETSYFLIRKRI